MPTYTLAGIDVHKRILVVAVAYPGAELQYETERFSTTASALGQLVRWLQERRVREVVMESTAQYWQPVWRALEGHFQLHLAQAKSNPAPHGRKTDVEDAKRLVRRLHAQELRLSFVPGSEQRLVRSLTRARYQLTCDHVRVQAQVESLLEEAAIKLSSFLSDLFGTSGRRILRALSNGLDDPRQLAALAHWSVQASVETLADALSAKLSRPHRILLGLHLDRLDLLEAQVRAIDQALADHLQPHAEPLQRLLSVPGLGVTSAQEILAQLGPTAQPFPSPAHLASWVGVCPGRKQSAGCSTSNRSPKGNRAMRRVLTQIAHAAVRTKGSHLQQVFHRLLPRLGYKKAIWAIAHRICRILWYILHEGASYIEHGIRAANPRSLHDQAKRIVKKLKALGFDVQLTPRQTQPDL
jgi:transposase